MVGDEICGAVISIRPNVSSINVCTMHYNTVTYGLLCCVSALLILIQHTHTARFNIV